MAGQTGLEPATTGVTGQYSNQTELLPRISFFLFETFIFPKCREFNKVSVQCQANLTHFLKDRRARQSRSAVGHADLPTLQQNEIQFRASVHLC